MIVVDTSALMALVLDEPEAARVARALETDDPILISAATLTETLIVARRRDRSEAMKTLIDGLALDVAPATKAVAYAVADAYDRWGKGVHPAGLNFGDCFAYALAKENDAPLLFVGGDFAATDVSPALA